MLLERESELAQATSALRRAAEGEGSLLVVRGPLGVGRSTFLEAVAARAHGEGFLPLRAQAAAAEENFAFGVVRQLADSALAAAPAGESGRRLREAASAAAPPVAGSVPPWSAVAPRQAPLRLTALLESMASERPVVVMVDDLQWADTDSLLALAPCLARRRHDRVLFVLTVLPGDVRGTREHVRGLLESADHTVELAALGRDSVRLLVEGACGTPSHDAFVDTLQQRSGGNPLWVTALVDEAQYQALQPTEADADAAAALRPERARRRLAAFLRSQPDHVRRVAYALTVLDAVADPHLVTRLAEIDEPRRAEAVGVLRLAGLVAEHSDSLIPGTLLRDLLEESMPATERTVLRGVAAELLHRTGHPAELAAEQLMSVITLRGPQAVEILRTAADSAVRRGSPRDAARYLRRALLDTSPTDHDRGRLLVDLATAERSFASAASLRHVAEAVPLLESVRERADAVTRLGPLLMDPAAFRIDAVRRAVTEELGRSDPDDWIERELALRLEAREHVLSAQDPAHVKRALQRFRSLGPSPALRTTGERELVTSLMHIAFVSNSASAEELTALCTRLLERETPAPEHVHSTVPLAVNVLAGAGRTEGAADWLREAHLLAQRRGGEVEQAVIRAEQALVALADGRLARARQKVLQADALAGTGTGDLPTICAAVLAIVALHTAEPHLAEQILTRHRLHAENQHLAALLHLARGTLAAGRGETRTALVHFQTAGRRAERIGWHNPVTVPWASCAALMHHRLGEQEEAVASALLEVERSRAWGAPVRLGRALVALGRVSPGREAVAVLEEAVEVLEKGSNTHELCQALYALGTRRETDRRRRAAVLERAHGLAVDNGDDSLAETIARKRDEHVRRPSSRTDRLTPSERKVAHLAATGLSNAAISARLGTTSRTVEKHLTNSYRKLGVSGRPDLARALEKLGETPNS
ncbi:LuxR family transcriptional regulator [Streptomyces sp. Tu 3180]|uniref:helix-turn-helix transcriptional regulator n=1 Tax=Streptomyces sp. Tu 3180 TaxID=2682611 RepID=UPI001356C0FB|nr:LuxR family transcriptional regulator [Streptomyces sp. Tu 3180]KAF3463535.1 AAA family ATPase [Streptomyces sp. Tu 3180]